MNDLISRQAAIDALHQYFADGFEEDRWWNSTHVLAALEGLPSAQSEKHTQERTETHACDCIDRQAAIDAVDEALTRVFVEHRDIAEKMINKIPSAQPTVQPTVHPQRTCVNCGRTVNNGGWYADGGTRCPIEEHYALPKDGYCHLWEKRNVTDDDYPERRTDEQAD